MVLCAAVAYVAAMTALPAPAFADGTFLLQLGSYDSESEANQKWAELKAKNPDVLGKLTLHVAEVAMPPDNTVSYRTQAGQLSTREQASSLCNTLQNRGIDCYVVETALFTGESMPDQAAASVAPAATVTEASASAPAVEAAAPTPVATSSTIDPATSTGVPAPVLTSTVVPMEGASETAVAQNSAASAAPPDAAPALPPTDHFVPGRGPKFLELPASMAPAPAEVAAAEPAPAAPAPAPAPAEKPGFFSRLFGFGSSQTAPASATVGNVAVAEAIRVPLSEGKTQQAPTHTPNMIPSVPFIHGLGGSPGSDSRGTFWAQLSYFHDEYQARSFYQDFHAAYPQFSDGVRVRITRPYSYATRPGHVSLRVGPFAGIAEIHAICTKAVHYHLRCTVVRDLGSSAATGTPGAYMANPAPVTRLSVSEPNAYWVQLGTYNSSDEAAQAWKTLRAMHHHALRRVRISVSSPTESSAQVTLFRLRAGPFRNEASADRLCAVLKNAAAGCVVLSDH